MQNAKLNNFDPSTRQAIREFKDWQRRVFAKNARKGHRFFQPDSIPKPTPRSAKEAWGGVYESDLKNKYKNKQIVILIATLVICVLYVGVSFTLFPII